MSDMVLLEESLKAISKLPDEEAGALIKALISGDDENLPFMADLVYPMIKGQVDRMTEFREKQRANGAKGGRPKNRPETQTKPNDNPNETQAEPKEKPPVPIPVPVKKEIPTVSRKKAFVPPTADEVNEYCRKNGYHIDGEYFVNWYGARKWMSGKTKIQDWKACVRTWVTKQKKDQDQQPQAPPNRNPKIQAAYGFSSERQDVNYNELALQRAWQEG